MEWVWEWVVPMVVTGVTKISKSKILWAAGLPITAVVLVGLIVFALSRSEKNQKTLTIYVEDYFLPTLDPHLIVPADSYLTSLFSLTVSHQRIKSIPTLSESVTHTPDFKSFTVKFQKGFKSPQGYELNAKNYIEGLRQHCLSLPDHRLEDTEFYNMLEPEAFLKGQPSKGLLAVGEFEVVFNFSSPRPDFLTSLEKNRLSFRSPGNYQDGHWKDPKSYDTISPWLIQKFTSQEIRLKKNEKIVTRQKFSDIVIKRLDSQKFKDIVDPSQALIYLNNSQQLPSHFKLKTITNGTHIYFSLNCKEPPFDVYENRVAFWQALHKDLSTRKISSTIIFNPLQLPKTKIKNPFPSDLNAVAETSFQGIDYEELKTTLSNVQKDIGRQVTIDRRAHRITEKTSSALLQDQKANVFITRKYDYGDSSPILRKSLYCSGRGIHWGSSSQCGDEKNFETSEAFEKLLKADLCLQKVGRARTHIYGTDDLPSSPGISNSYVLRASIGETE
ncbi:MAG: hypothetical protein K2Q26_09945 [Bdellovibrionales bacterium]|nr:hypothetical protein [Bdellovibrionales bacterium]